MKKLLLVLSLMPYSAHADISETLYSYIPDGISDVLTQGAKSGAKMVLGLEKKHNIVISTDPHTLALLTLMHREEIGLTPEEADQVKKKLLQHILAPKEKQGTQLPEATPLTEPTVADITANKE